MTFSDITNEEYKAILIRRIESILLKYENQENPIGELEKASVYLSRLIEIEKEVK